MFSVFVFSITTVLRDAFLEILASPPKSRSLNGNLGKTHPVNVTGEVNKSDTVASLGSSEFPPGFGGFWEKKLHGTTKPMQGSLPSSLNVCEILASLREVDICTELIVQKLG